MTRDLPDQSPARDGESYFAWADRVADAEEAANEHGTDRPDTPAVDDESWICNGRCHGTFIGARPGSGTCDQCTVLQATTDPPAQSPQRDWTDGQKLAGDLGMYLCEEIWQAISPIRLDCGTFRPAYDEEFAELGYDEDDDTVLLLRRESDGAFFEVEIEPSARRVHPKGGESRG